MKDKKILMLSIIGIIAVMSLVVGVTYAWFSTNISGSGAQITVNTAVVGPLTYTGSEITASRVLPGWISEDATLSINGTVTGEENVGYSCSIENTGEVTDVEYRISIDGELNSTSAIWTSIETNPIVEGSINSTNTSDTYKIGIRFKETGENQNDQQGKELQVEVSCDLKETYPLPEQILADNPKVSVRSGFDTAFTTSNNGNTIYSAAGQDGETTYYFAGSVSNNYVLFAGYYWRIVRINEDNSVRLIYAGTSAVDTAGFISSSQAFNTSRDNSAYVGYKYTLDSQYGTGTDSPIKTAVDNWYRDNINASYGNYISKTAIYCNDRTVGSGTWSATGSEFYYSAYTRLYTNKAPTFTCSNAADKFTASTTTGNNTLTYPIGLITADEISYAGGISGTVNTGYYIAQNVTAGASYWWTMSPYKWSSSGNSRAGAFVGGGSDSPGYLSGTGVHYTFGVRPVLSLKACVEWDGGDGNASTPYTVKISAECALAENEVLDNNTVRVSATTNDASIATVETPASIIKEVGSNHTFTFNVSDGNEYLGIENCNGVYDTTNNTLTLTNVQESTSCKVNFAEPVPFAEQILVHNPNNTGTRSGFSTVFNTSNGGNTMYRAAGQGGAYTYYFAGAVSNNYVLFAGKYWRIVRINEDNSVRLIYAGTTVTDTAGFISLSQAFNTAYTNSAYAGYKYTANSQYGNGTNSTIKTVVDNWYRDNINASYGSYVSRTAIYCNDRTVGSGGWCFSCGTPFYYSAYTRIKTNSSPSFVCSNNNDRFTMSTTTGNNALTYPVGMLTIDEASFAGGAKNGYGTASQANYLFQNAYTGARYWWTMSPSYYNSGGSFDANEFVVGGSSNTGVLSDYRVDHTYGVRPVLSLKSCVNWSSGDGTSGRPYQVSVGTACASAEN